MDLGGPPFQETSQYNHPEVDSILSGCFNNLTLGAILDRKLDTHTSIYLIVYIYIYVYTYIYIYTYTSAYGDEWMFITGCP